MNSLHARGFRFAIFGQADDITLHWLDSFEPLQSLAQTVMVGARLRPSTTGLRGAEDRSRLR
jgi:hypothetical protein